MKTTNIITKSIRALLPAALVATTFTTAGAATLASKYKFYGNSTAGGGYHVYVGDQTGQSSYTIRGYAKAFGYVFNKYVELAKADGRAISNDNETGLLTADIRVFGISVWDYTKGGSTTFNESFQWVKEQQIANLDFPVGPITINVKGGVSLAARAEVELKIEALDPNASVYTPVVKGSLKPRFEAALTASGGINAWVIKPSLEAHLTLVDIEMPAEASLRPVIEQPATPVTGLYATFATAFPTRTFTMTRFATSTTMNQTRMYENEGRTFIAAWDAKLKLKTLGGKLDAVVRYFNPNPFSWGWKTYRGNLIKWDGFSTTYNLASGSKEITLGGGPMVATQ